MLPTLNLEPKAVSWLTSLEICPCASGEPHNQRVPASWCTGIVRVVCLHRQAGMVGWSRADHFGHDALIEMAQVDISPWIVVSAAPPS